MNISDELTIVIPAKNEEKLLPRLLLSLEEQDYSLMANTKVILADADSTDRTIPIAMKFAKSLALTVIQGGLPSVGRNRGAICADSRYILFLDADIELADPTLIRRAVDLMKKKSLHCVTTDIFCCGGIWLDHFLYTCNNLVQRLSRFHKPFATGMFMLLDKEEFDRIGGFDEKALFAEDYQLTRQIERTRFRVLRGGIYSTNRRFIKMGHWKIIRFFVSTAVNGRKPNYYRNRYYEAYWEAY
ncbi:MAG TPA: glycosyltransferase [Acidobacteriota bacterium]|nr:glycosyltransferase [Acidobacteriota bacterium]